MLPFVPICAITLALFAHCSNGDILCFSFRNTDHRPVVYLPVANCSFPCSSCWIPTKKYLISLAGSLICRSLTSWSVISLSKSFSWGNFPRRILVCLVACLTILNIFFFPRKYRFLQASMGLNDQSWPQYIKIILGVNYNSIHRCNIFRWRLFFKLLNIQHSSEPRWAQMPWCSLLIMLLKQFFFWYTL